jgi:hypothetical protein
MLVSLLRLPLPRAFPFTDQIKTDLSITESHPVYEASIVATKKGVSFDQPSSAVSWFHSPECIYESAGRFGFRKMNIEYGKERTSRSAR